jgi:iron complex outermembrane receptor protein
MSSLRFLSGPIITATALAVGASLSAQTLQLDPLRVSAARPSASPTLASTVDLSLVPTTVATTDTLSARAANFHIAGNRARSFNDTISFRGLVNTPIFGDPAVTFYLDQIPLGSGFTFPTELAGFAQVSLLRGPGQNTLYGRAGAAGVITVNTPTAGANTTGSISASAGNYQSRQISASVLSQSTGVADAYVVMNYQEREGYVRNTRLNTDVDAQETTSALARARFRPSDTMELTFIATALKARDGAQPLVPLGGSFDEVDRSAEGVTEVDAFNFAFDAAFQLASGRLNATTSFTDWELGPYFNTLDFGFAEMGNGSELRQRIFNEEIRFTSVDTGSWRWSAGAFFSDGRTDGAFVRSFGPSVFEQSTYRIDARTLAVFGEASFKLSDATTLTAGARAEDTRKDSVRREIIPVTNSYFVESDSTAFLPKLALSYAVSSQTLVHASVGSGYKPGGISAFTGNAALAAFGPERTIASEIGVTQTNLTRTLTTAVRLFWYEIDGYQIERSFQTGAMVDDYLVVNAGRARSLGGEIELVWTPREDLRVSVDYGRTAVTLRDFRDPYTGVVFNGNQAPYVPVYDANVRVDYTHRCGFFAGVEGNFTGRTYYTEGEDFAFAQKSYALLGARVGFARNNWRVTVFGENLMDERYYSSMAPGTGHGTPGAPMTYGTEVKFSF